MMGKFLAYILGAVFLLGVLKISAESVGWLPLALFLGWLAWLQFGKDQGK